MVTRRTVLTAPLAMAASTLPVISYARHERTIRIGLSLAPTSLDPTTAAPIVIGEVMHYNVLEGLVLLDENGIVSPGLANSWEISDNGRTYTFKLKNNVYFHDGKPLNAEVVKLSFERSKSAKHQNKLYETLFKNIIEIHTPELLTVVLKLKNPNPLTLFRLAESPAVILHSDTADQAVHNPIGTGPFRFTSYDYGKVLTLKKWSNYRKAELVKTEFAEFHFIPDPVEQINAIRSGKIDMLFHMTAQRTFEFETNNKYEVLRGNSTSKCLVAINNKKAPLNNLAVRQAITHAIDREALIRTAFLGHGRSIGSHYAPSEPGYIDLTNVYPYNPAESRNLLKSAGINQPLKLNMAIPPTPYGIAGGPIIADALKQVGINLTLQKLSWEEWMSSVFKGDFDLSLILHAEPLDYHIYNNPDYYFGYNSPEYRQLLKEYHNSGNPRIQRQLIHQLQRKLASDAVNVWLFTPEIATVVRKGLKGVWMHYPIFAHPICDMYWE